MSDYNTPESPIASFFAWERSARCIDFKTIYCDMAGGDPLAGLMLSEIIWYWLPGRDGKFPEKVQDRNGIEWIEATYDSWWETLRITAKQAKRLVPLLKEHNLIQFKLMKLGAAPKVYVRLYIKGFMAAWNEQMEILRTQNTSSRFPQNQFLDEGDEVQKVLFDNDQKDLSISTKGTNRKVPKGSILYINKDLKENTKSIYEDDKKSDPEKTENNSPKKVFKGKTPSEHPTPQNCPPGGSVVGKPKGKKSGFKLSEEQSAAAEAFFNEKIIPAWDSRKRLNKKEGAEAFKEAAIRAGGYTEVFAQQALDSVVASAKYIWAYRDDPHHLPHFSTFFNNDRHLNDPMDIAASASTGPDGGRYSTPEEKALQSEQDFLGNVQGFLDFYKK